MLSAEKCFKLILKKKQYLKKKKNLCGPAL